MEEHRRNEGRNETNQLSTVTETNIEVGRKKQNKQTDSNVRHSVQVCSPTLIRRFEAVETLSCIFFLGRHTCTLKRHPLHQMRLKILSWCRFSDFSKLQKSNKHMHRFQHACLPTCLYLVGLISQTS